MKHWAKATVEHTTDDPPELADELAYQATRMILRIMQDAGDDVDFSKADIELVIDFHG